MAHLGPVPAEELDRGAHAGRQDHAGTAGLAQYHDAMAEGAGISVVARAHQHGVALGADAGRFRERRERQRGGADAVRGVNRGRVHPVMAAPEHHRHRRDGAVLRAALSHQRDRPRTGRKRPAVLCHRHHGRIGRVPEHVA